MNSFSKSSSYLIRNSHSYCFRIHIPKDIQGTIGRKEIRRSLHTWRLGGTDGKKTFYSFRHNVSNHLQGLVMASLIEEPMGRAGKTETRRRYTKGYRAAILYKECILKLKYKVDLSHLRQSKWVVR